MAAAELTFVVAATHAIWMRTTDLLGQALASHRLTPPTFQALWAIDPDAPPPSMKVMAERLHCNASNLTFITGQLVERGLAERAVDSTDRRSRVLALTAQGRRVRDELVEKAATLSPLAQLTNSELSQLQALLSRVVPLPSAEGHEGLPTPVASATTSAGTSDAGQADSQPLEGLRRPSEVRTGEATQPPPSRSSRRVNDTV